MKNAKSIWLAILLLPLLSLSIAGQTVEQVEFLKADSVETWQAGERYVIAASGLDAKRSYGAVVCVDAEWLEVHQESKPFPPMILEPYKPGKFLLEGDPGTSYYVSIRTKGPPKWLMVKIAGEKPKPDPPGDPPKDPDNPPAPAPDFIEIQEFSRDLAVKLNDPTTANQLAEAIDAAAKTVESLCDSGRCPTFDGAYRMVGKAIDGVLLRRRGRSLSVNWFGEWRVPIDTEAQKYTFKNPKQYCQLVKALARGLRNE